MVRVVVSSEMVTVTIDTEEVAVGVTVVLDV